MNDHRGKILRLQPNRVWRTYTGGLMLDKMEHRENPADGCFPEDWIGSTVRATNPDLHGENEGLSRVIVAQRECVLAELVASDPEYFFGSSHVRRFGANAMVLVKYLDAAVRLPFQVHPTPDFSRARLNSASGKAEAYYILSTRPEEASPFIYLGFQRPPSRTELRRMIVEQDIRAMEACFDPVPVHPGEIYVVPGGLPHAIGRGVLMVEVMEPTDFVARIEFNVAGRTIPESARFMGRDVEFALDMIQFSPVSVADLQARYRSKPLEVAQDSVLRRESLVDQRNTDRFRVFRTSGCGQASWQAQGFTVLLVLEGNCAIRTPGEEVRLAKFDRVVIPSGLGPVQISASEPVSFLECLPPAP